MQTAGGSPLAWQLTNTPRTSIVTFAKSPKKFIKKPRTLEQAGQAGLQWSRRRSNVPSQPSDQDEDGYEANNNTPSNKKQRLAYERETVQSQQLTSTRYRGPQAPRSRHRQLPDKESKIDDHSTQAAVLKVPKLSLQQTRIRASDSLLGDVPTYELGVDSYDWENAFLTTRIQRKQQLEQKRKRLFGRGWRQLDVRYYLLRRAKNAQAHAALLEQAPPQLQAARLQYMIARGEHSQLANQSQQLNFSAGSRYITGFASRSQHSSQDSQHVNNNDFASRQLTSKSETLDNRPTLAPIPRLKLPWRRGNGPLDDSLPKPATFFKLPVRWRKRILAERVVALRADLPTVPPAAAVHLYTHAPVMLCFTTRAVSAQIQAAARVLDVKHGRAARKIAGHPLLGLIDMDNLQITTASICYRYSLGYQHVVSALSANALLLTSSTDQIYYVVERLSQLSHISERQVMISILGCPELMNAALQPGLPARIQVVQQLMEEAFGLKTDDAKDYDLSDQWQFLLSLKQAGQDHDRVLSDEGARQAHMQRLLLQHPSIFQCKPSTVQHAKQWLEQELKLTSQQAAQALLSPGNAVLLSTPPQQLIALATTFCRTLQKVLQVDIRSNVSLRLPTHTFGDATQSPREDITAPYMLLSRLIRQSCIGLLELSTTQIKACIGSLLRTCQSAHTPSCLELLSAMTSTSSDHPQTKSTVLTANPMNSNGHDVHSQSTDKDSFCQLLYKWSIANPWFLLYLHKQQSAVKDSTQREVSRRTTIAPRARQSQPSFNKRLTTVLEKVAVLPDGRSVTEPLWLQPHPTANMMAAELLRLPSATLKSMPAQQQLRAHPINRVRQMSQKGVVIGRGQSIAGATHGMASSNKVPVHVLTSSCNVLQTTCNFKTEAAALLLWLLHPGLLSHEPASNVDINHLRMSQKQPAVGSAALSPHAGEASEQWVLDSLLLQRADVQHTIKQLQAAEHLFLQQTVQQPLHLSHSLDHSTHTASADASLVSGTLCRSSVDVGPTQTETPQAETSKTANNNEARQKDLEKIQPLTNIGSHPVPELLSSRDVSQTTESETNRTNEVQQQGNDQSARPSRRARGYIKQR